jgi:phosphatidylserine decarboxylase
MKIPIADACWKFLLPLIGLSVLGFGLIGSSAGLVGMAASLTVLYFFRDPERKPPGIKNAVLAPADGKVVGIERVKSAILDGQETVCVSIFMSLLDVHVNRAPMDGVINYFEHRPGKFINAMKPRAAEVNEHAWIGLQNGVVRILVRQIAGVIARRIITYCHVGENVARGERIGLICFGSRVESYLPTDTNLKVRLGMKVHAGRSVLGILPEKR